MKLLELNSTEHGGDFVNEVRYSENEMEEVFTAEERWALKNGSCINKGSLRYIELTAAARKAGLLA